MLYRSMLLHLLQTNIEVFLPLELWDLPNKLCIQLIHYLHDLTSLRHTSSIHSP